jgi:hypothetical protein
VDFERGPVAYRCVVPGDIVGICELDHPS